MWKYKDAHALVLPLVFLLALVFCTNATLAQPTDDESLVRSVVKSFFAAYQKKDVEGLTALWSTKAPEREAFTNEVKTAFAATGAAEWKSFAIHRVAVEGTSAIVRVKLESQATESTPGPAANRAGQLNRTLRLVKEDGQWKVWQYEPTERELATNLIAAKTETEQSTLLAGEPDLITLELVQALRKQADTFTQRREPLQAVVALRLMRSIAERIGDEQGVAYAVNTLGVNYYTRGEYQQALELFEFQLTLAASTRDRSVTARTFNQIGMIKRFYGDNAAALDWVQRSQRLAEEAGDKRLLSNALNNLGLLYREMGDYARALEYFEKSLTLNEALGEKVFLSMSLNNIGTVHGSQGDHKQALVYFERALRLGEAADDKNMIAFGLNNIGITHYRDREYPRALEYYQQSLALREQMNDKRGAALTLNNIGLLHREQGDHKKALEYYQQSLAIREKLDDQSGMAFALNHIGHLHYLQGDHQQALQISKRVIDIATRLVNPELIWRGYEIAGRAHTALKQFDEAEKALLSSINTVEQLRHRVGGGELARQRFFEDKLLPYMAMVELAVSRNRPFDALTYSELAKARTLLDVLRNGRIPINKAMSPEEQEMERVANAELTALNAQIYDERQRAKPNLTRIAELEPRREKARMAYEAFLTSLYVKHPELKVQRGEATPITATEAAALIPDPSTAIVEFVVDDDRSYLIVLTNDRRQAAISLKITLYPIKITANQLSERVDAFRRMLAERDLNYQDAARQLYDLLLKPAEEQLRGKKTLCVVPDRALWELPFQALQPKTGTHLIEDVALFYAPSLSVLREVTKRHTSTSPPVSLSDEIRVSDLRGSSSRSPKMLLAFGNPQLTGGPGGRFRGDDAERFGPLPEAEKEVKTLGRLYGAVRSRVFIGSEAREGVVKTEAPQYEVLHFATHGLLDNRNPMFSFLTLAQTAGDPNEDGLLEAREILNMDLQAKLAVLSACQTARGRVGAGEGVIGMSWALFVAGVPTTVASQWKVDSASTTSLMIDFHRRLTMQQARSRESKAESLRQAALKLLRTERHRHPFYWAGFVMIGDGW